MQVTKSQAMGVGFGGEVHMARINHRSQDWKPQPMEMAQGLFCCSKKGLYHRSRKLTFHGILAGRGLVLV